MRKKIYPVGLSNVENRERWLKAKLKEIPKGKKILDAGAGELQYARYCSHLNYTSQDFGQYDGVGDNRGLQTEKWDNTRLDIVSDIASIPVKDEAFDAVMCIEVFEHIPHPIEAIKELSRILKKSGILILTAPVSSLTHFAPYYFYNGFSKYFFEKYLQESMLEIIELEFNGNWFEYVSQELHRLPGVLEAYSKDVKLSALDRKAIKRMQLILAEGSNSNDGSEELLSYGIHLVAKKKA